MVRSRRAFLILFSGSAAWWGLIRTAWARKISIANSGWLELQNFSGQVIYQWGKTRQLAWSGLRLRRVGEWLESGAGAQATLVLDQGLGTVRVSENTRFRIEDIRTTASGGRVTLLHVVQGQVRLKVRPMKNPDSRLEIHTPAGINGVRGTEFAVAVQPSGKASVATLSGQVDSTALGNTVEIKQKLQSLTMPNEAPQEPTPLKDDPSLNIEQSVFQGSEQLRLVGQTDAVNSIFLLGEAQNTDQEGRFDWTVAISDHDFVEIFVVTPLGRSKRYQLPVR